VFGYDMLTTAAEEAKTRSRLAARDPAVAWHFYGVVHHDHAGADGMVPYTQLGTDAPVAHAFQSLGMKWIGAAISPRSPAS
jgi:APA family basic amino acid/polyamine antiporter